MAGDVLIFGLHDPTSGSASMSMLVQGVVRGPVLTCCGSKNSEFSTILLAVFHVAQTYIKISFVNVFQSPEDRLGCGVLRRGRCCSSPNLEMG